MPVDLIVIGGGEHARVIIDAALSRPDCWRPIGFLDRKPSEETVSRLGVQRLGTGDDPSSLVQQHPGALFVVGVGAIRDPDLREEIVSRFSSAGAEWATVVHRDATVSPTAEIGKGTVIFARAAINTGARVGAHCVVNTGAVVEHDAVVEDFSQIAPAAALGGGVHVGAKAYLGLGCRIRDHVRVGMGAVVAMGSVVIEDVADNSEVMGVPARERKATDESKMAPRR